MRTEADQIIHDKPGADDAAVVDLCSFLSHPAQFLTPDMITQHLSNCGLDFSEAEDTPSPDWVDRFIFQSFLNHLETRSARDTINLPQETPQQIRVREIALAGQTFVDKFSILSAAAQLRPFLISSVLKRQLARQREILGEDGWDIVTGGAQFLYRGIDAFGSPQQAYQAIFMANDTNDDARSALIAHGRTLLRAALASVNVFWAEVFAFRFMAPLNFVSAEAEMPHDIAGSLFKLWDRQCHAVLNT